MIEKSPLLTITAPVVTPLDNDRYRVEVEVSNIGYLPTNLTERGFEGSDRSGRNQIAKPVIATITVIGGTVAEGSKRIQLGHLAGWNSISKAVTGNTRAVEWIVPKGSSAAFIQITASSKSGGPARTGNVPLKR